jgi:hypothetical protein
LTFFLMKRGITCRNTWICKIIATEVHGIHISHEVLIHLVKFGVWCAVSARWIVVPVTFNETVNCEKYLCVERQHFQHLLWSVNCNYVIPSVIGKQAHWGPCHSSGG